MSYDLTFIRRKPWQTWGRALAACEKAAAVIEDLTEQDRRTWARLRSQARRLRAAGHAAVTMTLPGFADGERW